MNVKIGQRYQLAKDHGNEPGASNPVFHPDGKSNDDGSVTLHPLPDGYPLRAGSTGTAVAVAPLAEGGEDHVFLRFDATEPRPHVRHVSFTEAQMAELFEEVE
jgi:hypothetical protein